MSDRDFRRFLAGQADESLQNNESKRQWHERLLGMRKRLDEEIAAIDLSHPVPY